MTHHLKWCRRGRVPSYQMGAPIPYRKWTPTVVAPILCERGWHACRWEDAVHHISDELWVCELAGTVVAGADKVAAERLRLVRRVKGIDDRSLRLFAADCAERVLPIFERQHPGDDRPRLAIVAARAFAAGEIGRSELDAAGAAARAAARAVAGDAARAAARDAAAGDAARAAARAAARDAARAAGRDAAGDAARAVAGDAARAAAREWQTNHLLAHYAQLDPADYAHKG